MTGIVKRGMVLQVLCTQCLVFACLPCNLNLRRRELEPRAGSGVLQWINARDISGSGWEDDPVLITDDADAAVAFCGVVEVKDLDSPVVPKMQLAPTGLTNPGMGTVDLIVIIWFSWKAGLSASLFEKTIVRMMQQKPRRW